MDEGNFNPQTIEEVQQTLLVIFIYTFTLHKPPFLSSYGTKKKREWQTIAFDNMEREKRISPLLAQHNSFRFHHNENHMLYIYLILLEQ